MRNNTFRTASWFNKRLTEIARPLAPTEASRRWATLLQQIFEVDPLACPSCHGAMRIVAIITQTSVIDQILTHLRTHASREAHAGPRSPPSARRIGPRRHRAPHGARRSQPPFPRPSRRTNESAGPPPPASRCSCGR